jgi:hypothetical protein
MAFADLVKKQKKQGKGNFASLAAASGQKLLEKIDPRNILFKNSPLLKTLFPSLTGYTAGATKDKLKTVDKSTVSEPTISPQLEKISSKLDTIGANTMALPIIMRDMNIVRQGIIKLVKLGGGTQRDKADRFFLKSKEMENLYESKFQKPGSTKTPTKVEASKTGGSSFLGDLVSGGILSALLKGGLIVGILALIGKGIKEFFTNEEFRKKVLSGLGSIFQSFLEFLKTDFGQSLAIGVAAVVGTVALLKIALIGLVAAVNRAAAGLVGSVFKPTAPAPGKPGAPGKSGKGTVGKAAGALIRGKVLPLVVLGGILYYFDELTGKMEPAPADTPIPEGVPDITGSPEAEELLNPTGTEVAPIEKPELSTPEKIIAGAGAAIAVQQGVSAIKSVPSLAKATGTAILDVRTQSVGQLAKSVPTTKWGKFLAFVAKKSPNLFGKISVKLAQAGTLATIPIAGWIVAAIQLGFTFWTAWELYELWREFSNTPEEENPIETSPTKVDVKTENKAAVGPTIDEQIETQTKISQAYGTRYSETLKNRGQDAPETKQALADYEKQAEKLSTLNMAKENFGSGPGNAGVSIDEQIETQTKISQDFGSKYSESLKLRGKDAPETKQALADYEKQSEKLSTLNMVKENFGSGPGTQTTPMRVSTTGTNKALLDVIAAGESGNLGYEAYNKGKAGVGGKWPGLTQMTVGEVMELQKSKKLFAAGRYQIIPETLKGLIENKYGNSGVSVNDVFNSETQDKLGQTLANARLKQAGSDPVEQQYQLSKEWAAIPVPAGKPLQSGEISTGTQSYYQGKAGNKANINSTSIQLALGTQSDSPSSQTFAQAPSSPVRSTPTQAVAQAPSSPVRPAGAISIPSITMADSARMQMQTPIVVNAPQTVNNVQQGGSSGSIQLAPASVVDGEFMKLLVSRTV